MNIKESRVVTGSKESTLPATTFIDVFYHRGLPSEERRKFITWATEIALDAFGRKDAVEFRKSVLAVLQNHFVVFLLKGDRPFAFISTNFFEVESVGVLYVEGMAVKNSYQGGGVATKLVESAFSIACKKGLKIDFIAGKTQNPAVAKSRMNYCQEVYPISAPPTPLVIKIVNAVRGEKGLTKIFEEELLIERDSFPCPLSANRPCTTDLVINRFFDEHVGERDSVFIVGKI
ncbi:MAG: hypothetical protein A3A77_00810 [Candidatus Blackburnbacteria bacterium RIFCSPLOWO2_01_FULL_40_20]|uniref:N-acetyltransferase domain-containing protein n=1 Tax=Candidatus Blackburnbacteria bacterium RIFCSPLOWO2_01_FULL_40_20 TaxID=1797519 RepID=A0A1G1VAS2_9BACT|nr:MAG: hypothetical protein A3A77_00810 [Candidatus Blackburnbacteria bacterium RIFCSPLOWO2_01_FULL_40_20]